MTAPAVPMNGFSSVGGCECNPSMLQAPAGGFVLCRLASSWTRSKASQSIWPIHSEACILYAIVFLWQFPHFMVIAWMYREDYDRAGYPVLPKGNARIPFVTAGNPVAPPGSGRHQHCAISDTARCHCLLHGSTAESRVPVLRVGIRIATIAGGRTATARRVDRLPSVVFRTKRDICNQGKVDPIFDTPDASADKPRRGVVTVLLSLTPSGSRRISAATLHLNESLLASSESTRGRENWRSPSLHNPMIRSVLLPFDTDLFMTPI